jgi:prepilin-type N-terminal cleavage/methylation domain-containing protein
MTQNTSRRNGRAGFTLIEMMIAVAILGIAAVPLMGMYAQSRKAAADHLLFTQAVAALALQSEAARSLTLAELGARTGPLDDEIGAAVARLPEGTAQATLAPMPGEPGLTRVELGVGWKNPWGANKTLTTVVVRTGP